MSFRKTSLWPAWRRKLAGRPLHKLEVFPRNGGMRVRARVEKADLEKREERLGGVRNQASRPICREELEREAVLQNQMSLPGDPKAGSAFKSQM